MAAAVRDDAPRVMRFSREEDDAALRAFLFPRANPRLAESRVPECHNVVGLANYEIAFDPFKLLREFPNLEFQQKDFPAVIWRGRPPRGTTLLVFKSGRTVQMGMSSDMAFNHAVQRFRLELVRRNYMPMLKPLRYENRVYSHETGFPVAVWEIEFQDELGCAYIPSLFPGLVYRMFLPPVTALVFVSGKLMLLGIRRKEHLEPALDHLEPILRQHRHHGHNPGEQRKSVARQADRMLQARARVAMHGMNGVTINSGDPNADKKAMKDRQKRMKKAVRIASKSTNIFSLEDLRKSIDSEYERLLEQERKKREREELKRQAAQRETEEMQRRQERRQARHEGRPVESNKRPRLTTTSDAAPEAAAAPAAPAPEDMPDIDQIVNDLMK